MNTRTIMKLGSLIAMLLLIVSINSCKDDTKLVDPPDNNGDDTTVTEFIQWEDEYGVFRVKSKDFISRDFEVTSFDSTLSVNFEHDDMPATDLRISYITLSSILGFEFKTQNCTPNNIGDETNNIGIWFVGYKSGTGKFAADKSYQYGHCKVYKVNDNWVFDFKDVVVKESSTQFEGKVSAVIVWRQN